ncbi:hypothetical protein KY290_003912 [Solanum tuberosum]|uniref:Uncharacterized protein n=1 Tax=Solanum tuberosum TaxID=4113 RepID=A0ABQ7WU68_SOLTU|nr:hypothetical protein KY290_003912 [Solanum tuberosum]
MKLPLTELHDIDGSNSGEEENSHDNVALFEKSPSLHTSGLLVVFACQGVVISNASSRLVEIDYPFADIIWLRTVPCWHDSLEQFRWGDQAGVQSSDILVVWYRCAQDMRQSGFVSRECHFLGWMTRSSTISSSALLHSTLIVIRDQGKKIVEALSLDNFFLENEVSIPTSVMHYVDVYLEADNEKSVEEFDGQHKLSPFPFAPAGSNKLYSIQREGNVITRVYCQVEHPSAGNIYGVLETVEWAAHQRLPHGLGTTLVFVILLNKCVIVGKVIPELQLIMSKNFTVNQKECGYNWLISVPMERFGGMRVSDTIHRCFKPSSLYSKFPDDIFRLEP